MMNLELEDTYLRAAAHLLSTAANSPQQGRALPMLQPETYTQIGELLSDFMRATTVAIEAVSDATAAAAATTATILTESTAVEAELSRVLEPNFISSR
jgi:formiminotetrahydrofolate cyclodeaminase